MLSLYLHLSSLNLCYLISAVVVILFCLDCFINSVLAYVHIPHIYCLIISLNHITMLSLCLQLSSLNLCHLIYAVVVILFCLDCFINSVLVYVHVPHIYCLIISLNW